MVDRKGGGGIAICGLLLTERQLNSDDDNDDNWNLVPPHYLRPLHNVRAKVHLEEGRGEQGGN